MTTEDDQRSRLEQDAVAGGTGRGHCLIVFPVEVSRPIVIDGRGRNGQHCDRRQQGENRHQQEYGALREFIADRARQ